MDYEPKQWEIDWPEEFLDDSISDEDLYLKRRLDQLEQLDTESLKKLTHLIDVFIDTRNFVSLFTGFHADILFDYYLACNVLYERGFTDYEHNEDGWSLIMAALVRTLSPHDYDNIDGLIDYLDVEVMNEDNRELDLYLEALMDEYKSRGPNQTVNEHFLNAAQTVDFTPLPKEKAIRFYIDTSGDHTEPDRNKQRGTQFYLFCEAIVNSGAVPILVEEDSTVTFEDKIEWFYLNDVTPLIARVFDQYEIETRKIDNEYS